MYKHYYHSIQRIRVTKQSPHYHELETKHLLPININISASSHSAILEISIWDTECLGSWLIIR